MMDVLALRAAAARHGAVIRVVIAGIDGSSPREAGASMLVWADGQSGTVGGGALEWDAAGRARAMLTSGGVAEVTRVALGPTLGQCCGGAVTLVAERWDAAAVARLTGDVIARALPGAPLEMPLPVSRILARARGEGVVTGARIVQGWLVEPVARPTRDIWVWGAGHVGRALVAVIAPLPGICVTWVDTGAERFPDTLPDGVIQSIAPNPGTLVTEAPPQAEHFILTYSHTLDLDLCHRLLAHGFRSLGLIGSATKRARFRSRLAALGHTDAQIARIACPIGDPALGKHPQAIAVSVAAALLSGQSAQVSAKDRAG
jgi:xanthine dehydrogenase accessory factor